MKLEFGNPQHIEKANRGIICVCGHSKSDHCSNGCNGEGEGKEWHICDCGNEHEKAADCKCDGLKIQSVQPLFFKFSFYGSM